MKHLLLILFVLVAGYAAWNVSDKYARRAASKFFTRHAIRLGLLVIVVLLMLAAAVNLPSTQLL